MAWVMRLLDRLGDRLGAWVGAPSTAAMRNSATAREYREADERDEELYDEEEWESSQGRFS
jgi:hypothetical protein